MFQPLDREQDKEKQPGAEWKDYLAMLIAVYQLLLPKLLAVITGVIVATYLLLWLWR